ncbi:calcium-binding protein [Rhodobacteraceae bacterium]|nr:calcium-binding protein [Paracoccaceae bacterium]
MDNATLKIVALSTLILAGTGVAYAQGQENAGRSGPSFETLDADGSGEITAEDLKALRDARFAELDTDGNGSASEAEYTAAAASRAGEQAAARFARLDADGDGTLSRDVLENRRGRGISERMITRFDADNSGGVSAEEFETAKEQLAERGGRRHGKGGGRGGDRGRN